MRRLLIGEKVPGLLVWLAVVVVPFGLAVLIGGVFGVERCPG